MNNYPNPWLQGDYTPDHLVGTEPILHPASASVHLPVTTVVPKPGRPATICNTWKGSLQTDSSAPPSVSRLQKWAGTQLPFISELWGACTYFCSYAQRGGYVVPPWLSSCPCVHGEAGIIKSISVAQMLTP